MLSRIISLISRSHWWRDIFTHDFPPNGNVSPVLPLPPFTKSDYFLKPTARIMELPLGNDQTGIRTSTFYRIEIFVERQRQHNQIRPRKGRRPNGACILPGQHRSASQRLASIAFVIGPLSVWTWLLDVFVFTIGPYPAPMLAPHATARILAAT